MKRVFLPFLLVFLLFSCLKDKLTVSFDLNQKVSFSFPPSTPLGLINLPLIPINPDWSSSFSAQNSDLNHLKSLHAKSIMLNVTSPAGQNLRFLKSISVYISATGQNESLLAYKTPVPDSVGSSMQLDIPDLDIAPYVKQNTFNIRVSFEQRQALFKSVNVEADMNFGAVAFLLN